MKTRPDLFTLLFLVLSVSSSCNHEDLLMKEDSSQEDVYYEGNSVVPEENFQTNSQSVEYDNAVTIRYEDTGTVTVVNPWGENGVEVTVVGQHVSVSATIKDVNYVLSGTTMDGSFKVYSTNRFNLILNGVSLCNPSGAAINSQTSKTCNLTLVDQTSNRLIDGSEYTFVNDEDMKGAFFSEGQVLFGGTGSLLVYGNHKHAICVDDYIEVNSGSITVNNAASDGIHCNKYFKMNGGNVRIESQSDCIESEKANVWVLGGVIEGISLQGGKCLKSETDVSVEGGTLQLTARGSGAKVIKSSSDTHLSGGVIHLVNSGNACYDSADGEISSPSGIKTNGNFLLSGDCELTIQSTGQAGKGISADGSVTFSGGRTEITTSGAMYKYSNRITSSAKAVKAKGDLTVDGGTIRIKTSTEGAEGLESKGTFTIQGGEIEIESYDDAINAGKHIAIHGGNIYCYSSGNDGIDSNGTLTITGGVVVASGANSPEDGIDCDHNTFTITGGTILGVGGSTSTPTSSVCTQRSVIWKSSSFSSGQLVGIEAANGANILTFKIPRAYSGTMTLLFSSPDLQANTSYLVYKGGSVSGGSDFHGLYSGALYAQGTQSATFTTGSMVTTVGSSGGSSGGGRPF